MYPQPQRLLGVPVAKGGKTASSAGGPGTLDPDRADALSTTFGRAYGEALADVEAVWRCELRLLTGDGRALTRSAAQQMIVVGFEIESATHLRLLLGEGPEDQEG